MSGHHAIPVHSTLALSLILGLGALDVQAGPYIPITDPLLPAPRYVPWYDAPSPPNRIPGKAYSHELDRSSTHAGVVPDDQQNTQWDGSGGIMDGLDYNGIGGTSGNPNDQVDAVASKGDALYSEVIANRVPALYSLRDGDEIQGSGTDVGDPVYYERTGGASGTWATWPQVDQNGGTNLDGLEVWGPEGIDDADRYSLFNDSATGCSVFRAAGGCWITLTDLAGVVIPFLTSELQVTLGNAQVDVDAMMTLDTNVDDVWDSGDSLLFSLWPVDTPAGGTHSLIGDLAMVWNFDTDISWFNHGGHTWEDGWLGTNVDALEAAVSEPGSIVLTALGLTMLGLRGRRWRRT